MIGKRNWTYFLTYLKKKKLTDRRFEEISSEHILVDSEGNVYIADIKKRCIEKFSTEGEKISHWDWVGGKVISQCKRTETA